ncbi:hypothetical protein [Actinoplanes sp. NPDC051411]|uniref:hypothetical protein n=1 Tax=Actinoplanes sp. NPDC051411 TaxID=3155522 RepID=UPI00343A61FC
MVHSLKPLSGADGVFAMAALDHRESLRTMLREHGGAPFDEFKLAGVRALAPLATALLLELETARRPECRAALPPSTGLILAADVFDQPPGQPVLDSGLDERITPAVAEEVGAHALKLLVLWRPDSGLDERARLMERFAELCRRCGLVSLVEGIVRPPAGRPWTAAGERHEAIFTAALELCSFGVDVYKAEMPGYLPGDVSRVREASVAFDRALGRPWVVLSNGVRAEDFRPAMTEAVAGGAHGFLAGRAVWSTVLDRTDIETALDTVAAERLRSFASAAREARLT